MPEEIEQTKPTDEKPQEQPQEQPEEQAPAQEPEVERDWDELLRQYEATLSESKPEPEQPPQEPQPAPAPPTGLQDPRLDAYYKAYNSAVQQFGQNSYQAQDAFARLLDAQYRIQAEQYQMWQQQQELIRQTAERRGREVLSEHTSKFGDLKAQLEAVIEKEIQEGYVDYERIAQDPHLAEIMTLYAAAKLRSQPPRYETAQPAPEQTGPKLSRADLEFCRTFGVDPKRLAELDNDEIKGNW